MVGYFMELEEKLKFKIDEINVGEFYTCFNNKNHKNNLLMEVLEVSQLKGEVFVYEHMEDRYITVQPSFFDRIASNAEIVLYSKRITIEQHIQKYQDSNSKQNGNSGEIYISTGSSSDYRIDGTPVNPGSTIWIKP
jgi:hypothetical protein